MLPAIAFIVAAYATYRIISDILHGPGGFPNKGLYIAAVVIGLVMLLFILSNCIDVYHAGTTTSSFPTP
jgi:hypothetical protein